MYIGMKLFMTGLPGFGNQFNEVSKECGVDVFDSDDIETMYENLKYIEERLNEQTKVFINDVKNWQKEHKE